ncbi:MAG: C10 family peptidase [Holophaga sp.]|nr:C10 family peptidase [Holophaga sp.]
MIQRPLRPACTVLGLLLATGAAWAGPVTGPQAQQAVKQWLQRGASPLKTLLCTEIASVETHRDAAGRALFHEVRLAPEGFVVVGADDLLEPIIAFAPQGILDKNPENHLYLMLQKDLRARMDQGVSQPSGKNARLLEASRGEAAAKWQALLGVAGPTNTSIPSVEDVRVAPLVQSKWDQGSVGGYQVYNYYTPNNYVCGCVATAMVQLMRFHQFPTTGIGAKTFQIHVDNLAQNKTTRGGDGSGGAYDWSQMPLVPNSSTPEAQRQMIGALSLDAGLAVHMYYAGDGSGSNMFDSTDALRTTFKYTNAIHGFSGGELTGKGLAEMVQPNLDAGYPVLFGITGDGGHAIVCDGYGYSSGTLYHHLNLGWGGSSNAWYNLPNIGTNYHFNVIDDCVYNVFPAGAGEILSGRVTDGSGAPISGVAVTDGTANALTDAKGIFALKGLNAGQRTLTATKTGMLFPQAVRLVGTSTDGAEVGNVWGVDLVQGSGATPTIKPQPVGQDVKLGGSATFTAGATGIGPLNFQWTKNGNPVATGASYTLASAAEADDKATIGLHVTGGSGFADSTPVTVNVVRLFNGDFEKGSSGWDLWNPGVVLGPGAYTEVDPHAGGQWLCIGDWSSACTDYAMQDITLPSIGTVNLSFWAGIANKSKTPASAANLFKVKVLDQSGATLGELKSLSNLDAAVDAGGKVIWKSYGPFSLNAWRGSTIRLRIESVQPGSADTGTVFAIDDVVLQTSNVDTSTVVLTMDHPSAFVLPGASATFTVSGDQGLGVDWAVPMPATHVDQGLTTTVTVPDAAPLVLTSYTLKATLKADPSKYVLAPVIVKGMDLVADGSLNPLDLLGFAAEWGKPNTSPANFKATGTVDDTDLAALLSKIK